ncbi:related to serine-threonine kinase [Cephalotrichum gorgonifer]|uniref:non-specific serine/threonine protein kinase n=1 Tax=Cephalotrichum gorgonifer TaxID=2041049 RepID=A0AAE8N1C7_9PEZI|nr:related to serine-threonine kinase [Cephalotrichum gorgonifer]
MADPRQASSSGREKQYNNSHIGDFVVGAEIGKGSFAQVYMGWHKVTRGAVAIKSVEVDRLNKKLKENLYGEIQILKTLRHPHIVALHDCVDSGSHINLVMEYCELGDLSFFIKKRDKHATHPATYDLARKYPCAPNSGLHEVVIRHFLKQLTSALKFLREMNYVHRDVKPQNLLLLPSPEYRKMHPRDILEASQDSLHPVTGLTSLPMLKLADFGFARVLPSTSLADTLCGSPLYMAPEILRYERYDAKADLWSVGTVVFEMATGRPPFKARNHVELLRKIEANEDVIKFPRETVISPALKALIRGLLKRNPVERTSFEKFFADEVITGPIPGLVEDDVPPPMSPPEPKLGRTLSGRSKLSTELTREVREVGGPASPNDLIPRSPVLDNSGPQTRRPSQGGHDTGTGLGIRQQQVSQAPAVPAPNRPRTSSSGAAVRPGHNASSPPSSLLSEQGLKKKGRVHTAPVMTEAQERAAQEVAFERDYVVVEKRQVEVNAFADEMAASPRFSGPGQAGAPTQTGQVVRRPSALNPTTGSAAGQQTRAIQINQGKGPHVHQGSYDKGTAAGNSPVSASSAISKAIQDASLRLFGIRVPPARVGNSHSPPMYSPFPAYPTPTNQVGLLDDGRRTVSQDEDGRVAQTVEDYANRSDCVYGFAEVKFKQLFPMAPSMEHGLGGIPADEMDATEEGLTVDAVVTLSEEALVLYVKALAMLAKAMDIASLWWQRKMPGDGSPGSRDHHGSPNMTVRINSAVQWVRSRFNEVLEKSEVVRLKLCEAQKQLPEDHPSHPSNHGYNSSVASGSGVKQVFLTPGISAEKLMYDRAIDMSRTAAIDEIANEHLPDCEAYYITAIRMLEAVLDVDDDSHRVKSGLSKDHKAEGRGEVQGDLDAEDRKVVKRMISMITKRLTMVRQKRTLIAEAEKAQLAAGRQRSGDMTPRSVRSHASS